MRTYGEGFIIADQSPGLIDMSVIRNTNTKIILRLPDLSDRELVGKAASLSDEQIVELSKLPTFVASVYQNDWLEPVLCKTAPESGNGGMIYEYRENGSEINNDWKDYVSLLVMPVRRRNELDRKYVDGLIQNIYRQNISARTKVAFLKYLVARNKDELQKYRRLAIYGFFNSERAFSLSRSYEKEHSVWYRQMCDALTPDINLLDEAERQKVIANLAMENAAMSGSREATALFEEMMRNL